MGNFIGWGFINCFYKVTTLFIMIDQGGYEWKPQSKCHCQIDRDKYKSDNRTSHFRRFVHRVNKHYKTNLAPRKENSNIFVLKQN